MSEHSKIIVGLEKEELADYKDKLYHSSYGYEDGEVWEYIPEPKKDSYFQAVRKPIKKENDSGDIYGIEVIGTWNGAIDLEEISDIIEKAKQVFKKITGKKGKVYFIGEQT